jgi:hypothetical protein
MHQNCGFAVFAALACAVSTATELERNVLTMVGPAAGTSDFTSGLSTNLSSSSSSLSSSSSSDGHLAGRSAGWPSKLTAGQQPDLLRAEQCSQNDHCRRGVTCDTRLGLCQCSNGYISARDYRGQPMADQINWPPSHCYRATALLQPCIYDEQCIQPHSRCTRDEQSGAQLHCACAHGFAVKGQSFLSLFNGSLHEKALEPID